MGRGKLNGQSGGAKINGIVKDYIVQAGSNISAGDFIQYTSTMTAGSDTLVRSDYETRYMTATEIDSIRVLLAYTDGGNNYYGTAVVVTISDQSASLGTPIIFNSSETKYIKAITLSQSIGKVLLSYCGSGNYTRTVVLTVTGTTITFGSSYPVSTSYPSAYGGAYNSGPTLTLISETSVLMCFNMMTNGSNYFVYSIVITISGNTISYGTYTQIYGAMAEIMKSVKLNNTQVLLLYCTNGSYSLACNVLTVNGTSVSTGSNFNPSQSPGYNFDVVCISSTLVFIAFSNGSDNNYLYGVFVTISGTYCYPDPQVRITTTSLSSISIIKTSNTRIFIFGQSSYQYCLSLTFMGNTFKYNAQVSVSSNQTALGFGVVPLTNNKGLVLYKKYNSNALYQTGYLNICKFVDSAFKSTTQSQIQGVAKAKGSPGETIKVYTLD